MPPPPSGRSRKGTQHVVHSSVLGLYPKSFGRVVGLLKGYGHGRCLDGDHVLNALAMVP